MKRVTTSLSLLLALSLSSFGWGQRLSETGALLEYGNGALAELESEFGDFCKEDSVEESSPVLLVTF